MLKQALSASIIATIIVACFWAYETYAPLPQASQNYKTPILSDSYLDDDIEYLNDARRASKLPTFSFSNILQNAAKNHALYLNEREIISHDENPQSPLFTGIDPAARALKAGYNNSYVVENLSSKQLSLKDSLDGLLSAIYHRFNFLNFNFDELGYFVHNDIYAYEIGNKQISKLCLNNATITSGTYIINLCKNKDIKIPKDDFDEATKPYNPNFIVFPNEHFASVAIFGKEDPDPLPHCDITSAPVSIEFNENLGEIKLKSFELFKDGKKLENTLLLHAKNDPNHKFNDRQFALFSLKPFEFGAQYSAKVVYENAKNTKSLQWGFLTKTPKYEYFSVDDGDIIHISPLKYYEIYFKPNDCKDALNEYTYIKQSGTKLDIAQSAPNTLRIKARGKRGDVIELKMNDTKSIKIVLNNSSTVRDYASLAGLWAILSVASFLFLMQRKR